jgi:ABC-type bacteriocin/lantibiotic exporter with double-glycine peptidase domain
MFLLQADELTKRLPNFQELVTYYGPYLALLLIIIIAFLIMQYVWFSRVLKSKNQEISRLVTREKELNDRLLSMIDKKIGFKEKH